MKKKFKIAAVWLMINILTLGMLPFYVYAEEETQNGADSLGLTAKACILMEASTGSVIYENNADEQLSPASITKGNYLRLCKIHGRFAGISRRRRGTECGHTD